MAAREAASAPGRGPWANLTGGIWNVATAPFQVPATIVETSVQRNVLYGASLGTAQGVAKGVMNAVTGVFRVATAVIPANPLELVQRKIASTPVTVR